MTNLEKIDCAIKTTLEAHPDYYEIMTAILMKKLLEEDPLVTAKFFSRANDARAHMIEVSDLDLLSEVIKNAVKVSLLLEKKQIEVSKNEEDLDGSKDDILFGSTACNWITETLKNNPGVNIDQLLEKHPEILTPLVSVFNEVRYGNHPVITIKELDNLSFISEISSVLDRIDRDIHVCEVL